MTKGEDKICLFLKMLKMENTAKLKKKQKQKRKYGEICANEAKNGVELSKMAGSRGILTFMT